MALRQFVMRRYGEGVSQGGAVEIFAQVHYLRKY